MQIPGPQRREMSSTNHSATPISIIFVTRILLGLVFVYASVDKILHPEAFAKQIYAYQLLPETWISAVAISLPWLEMILGSLLIFGVWLHGAVALTNLLLLSFFTALLINIFRGIDVDCGCFSTTSATPGAMWTYLLRDLFFLALSLFLLLRVIISPNGRPATA